MGTKRRNRGFQPVGSLRADQLGLPVRRARELRLFSCWKRVAGESLARRAPVRGVVRGVLEVELVTSDPSWERTLLDVLPELGARLAAICPELRFRRVRLIGAGDAGRGTLAIRAAETASIEPARPAARSTPPKPAPVRDVRERLRELMDRYEERAASRRGQKP